MSIHSSYTNDEGDDVAIDLKDEQSLNPQETAIKSQKNEIIRELVSLLPHKYRRLVKLRYFDELSYDEIAEQIGAPLGTVKAQLHRARELLYDIIKNKRNVI